MPLIVSETYVVDSAHPTGYYLFDVLNNQNSINSMLNDIPEMTANDVIEIVHLFNQNHIDFHIDGGWGVDALLEQQTRNHADLDIAVQHKDIPQIRALLEAQGYSDKFRDDTSDCNFVLGDSQGHQIDIHSYTFDSAGNHIYGIAYPFDSLTGTGLVNGHPVKCISPEWMVKFHTGYKFDENDYYDVKALCQRFSLDMPLAYKVFEIKSETDLLHEK
jgi:lincosamide nucleotidyltransferase A/C/D/E